MSEQLFDIIVRYVFEGTYTMSANSLDETKEKIRRGCGLVMGGHIHITLDEDEVEWGFPLHPETCIVSGQKQPEGWEEWWKNTDIPTRERIIGCRQADFSPENGCQEFTDTCNEYWNELPALGKKKVWKRYSR